MKKSNIAKWVEEETEHLPFRQAVHTVLVAISGTEVLKSSMVMKGGVLLALGYRSHRYTRDIDFSTPSTLEEFDKDDFRERLDEALVYAVERLGYGLDCRIQKIEQRPAGEDASFPTIKTNVGYAYKNNKGAHKRLLALNSSQIVKLDYSLNEPVGDVEFFELEEGDLIRVYDTVELVAEKFRALFQQEMRNRSRAQDLYDIYHILGVSSLDLTDHAKKKVLKRLIEKAAARGLDVSEESMSKEEIIRRTREGYEKILPSTIEEELTPFDVIYPEVEVFYRSLPWS